MQRNSRVFFPGLSRDTLTTCIAHIFFTWVLPWLQYWSSLFTLRLQSINSVITRLLTQKAFYFSLDIKAKQHRARLTWVGWEVNLGQEKMCSTGWDRVQFHIVPQSSSYSFINILWWSLFLLRVNSNTVIYICTKKVSCSNTFIY